MSAILPAATTEDAQRLVHCAYGILDLFAGRTDALLRWSQGISPEQAGDQLPPDWWAAGTVDALRAQLVEARVSATDGAVDRCRMLLLQQVIEMLPHVQAEELERRPAPAPKIVFTVPRAAQRPDRARSFADRGLAACILRALASSDERTLLASPYWSDAGAENLWDALARSAALALPITLAGARTDPDRDDLGAMLRLADRLRSAGTSQITALRYVPPQPGSLFHGKLVCGRVGYLGSANLTRSGLAEHVEAGMPLSEFDVLEVWSVLDAVRAAGMLVEQAF
jgi:hypothetical protein